LFSFPLLFAILTNIGGIMIDYFKLGYNLSYIIFYLAILCFGIWLGYRSLKKYLKSKKPNVPEKNVHTDKTKE